MADEDEVYERAVRLLAARDHGCAELGRKLAAKGGTPAAIAVALERLAAARYVDDETLVGREVQRLVGDGRGPAVVRQKLRTRGFPAEAIEAAVQAAVSDGQFAAACGEALRRRFGRVDGRDRAAWIRAARFLAGRGFDESTVRATLRAEGGDEDEG
jgi:regulatory protein